LGKPKLTPFTDRFAPTYLSIKRMKLKYYLFLSLILLKTSVCAQEVFIVKGNVQFRSDTSAAVQPLTTSGLDTSPTISPGHEWVAFIRRTPKNFISTGAGDEEAHELWVVKIDGTDSRKLVGGRQANKMENVLAGLANPQFSPDGRNIYFESAAWATSGAIHVVDRNTGAEHFVCSGSLISIVPRGNYIGHLIVSQHRYFLVGGSYDWIWLLSAAGQEVGPLGDSDSSDVSKILHDFQELFVDPQPSHVKQSPP
jgi:dipeptidyl aminopeptidase/acylaminoacyl peptidase